MPPIPNPKVSQNAPNCAQTWLYQIGQLHYYQTVDCGTGATGYGTWGSKLDTSPDCCATGTCAEGFEVDPTLNPLALSLKKLWELINPRLSHGEEKGRSRHGIGKTQSFAELHKSHLLNFKRRYSDKPGDVVKDRISKRRYDVVEYLFEVTDGTTTLQKILQLPIKLRNAYLDVIDAELRTVRMSDDLKNMSDSFFQKDKDLSVELISPLGTYLKVPSAEVTIAVFNAANNIDLVKLANKSGDAIVFFRLQRVKLVVRKEGEQPVTIYQYVGQQVDDPRTVNPQFDVETIPAGNWRDRQSHFHVISVLDIINDPTGKTRIDFFVYSADDLSEETTFK